MTANLEERISQLEQAIERIRLAPKDDVIEAKRIRISDDDGNVCVEIDATQIKIHLPVPPGVFQPSVAISADGLVLGNGGGNLIQIEPGGFGVGTDPSPIITFTFKSATFETPPAAFKIGFNQ